MERPNKIFDAFNIQHQDFIYVDVDNTVSSLSVGVCLEGKDCFFTPTEKIETV